MTDSARSPDSPDARTDSRPGRDDPAGDDGSIVLLHVEPYERSAELLGAFAERFADGVVVQSVGGAAAALDAIDAVDCVVTEQRLPDGYGVDLTERLREVGPGVPVVFHTTCPSEEREAAAFGAGADAYFEKGSARGRFDAILGRIRRLVDERRGREGNAGSASTPRPLGSTGEMLRSEE